MFVLMPVILPIAYSKVYADQRRDIEVAYGPQDTVVRVETTRERQGREQAEKWLCLAANEGHAHAQDRLGDAYRGDTLLSGNRPQDPVKAYLWYSLAIVNGSPFSEKSREDLAKEMTPAQITEAERRVREWKPGDCGAEASPTKSAG